MFESIKKYLLQVQINKLTGRKELFECQLSSMYESLQKKPSSNKLEGKIQYMESELFYIKKTLEEAQEKMKKME